VQPGEDTLHCTPHTTLTHPTTTTPQLQVEFLPQCDKVCIMDEGNCVYYGPWNADAAEILSRYLPASHLLAAAGNAEQPRDDKKKPAKKETKTEEKVGGRARAGVLG